MYDRLDDFWKKKKSQRYNVYYSVFSSEFNFFAEKTGQVCEKLLEMYNAKF